MMTVRRWVATTPAVLIAALAIGAVSACGSFASESQAVEPTEGGGASDATIDALGPDATGVPDSAVPVADGGADEAAVDAGPGCGSRIACQRTVFVTKATFTGAFGYVEGADLTCQTAADATDHPKVVGRKYIAWLSGGSSSGTASTPAARIAAQGQAPYVLPTGEIVAADWSKLATAQHQHAINVDEFGTVASNVSSHAWTGAASSGAFLGGQCTMWTKAESTVMGHQGDINSITATWSDEQERPCNSEARLYCIEK